MANTRAIINVGFARCGTTATDKFFRKNNDFGTPKARKELKHFLDPFAGSTGYLANFSEPKSLIFEASPPYTHNGIERFEAVLQNIEDFRSTDVDVTIFFCIRNLLSRAFSHYWHDIGSQYARFGNGWSVREVDDPKRFQSLYVRSFIDQLIDPKSADKFLPQVAVLIELAIKCFGADAVRIAYTKDLDQGVSALLTEIGSPPAEPVKTARITGAAAPLYVYAPNDTTTVIETNNGPRTVKLRKNTCLLFSRHSAEVLSGAKWPLPEIVAASTTWTRVLPVDCIPGSIMEQIKRATDGLDRIPDQCFLAQCKEKILKDVHTMPEKLQIRNLKPSEEALDKLLKKLDE